MFTDRLARRWHVAFAMAVVVAAALPAPARAAEVPSPVLNLTAAAGDNMVLLRWDPPVDDGGAPITSYVITTITQGVVVFEGEVFPVGNELTIDENQLAINTLEAAFTLGACNAVGCGGSAPSNTVTPTAGAVVPDIELASIPPGGGTAATDPEGVEPSAANPVITSVTVPATASGGSLSIAETTVSQAPAGYTFLGQDIVIASSATTDASNPLSITFRVDPAQVPVTIFRNGVPISESCASPGIADPTPCIADGGGTAAITILTAAASTWNVGIAAYAFSGFQSPVDNQPATNLARAGRAIPVRFALGGDVGLNVFAAGSPRSRQVACDVGGPVDSIEETLPSGTALSYSAGTGLYQLGWNTSRSWAGTCRELILTFREGTEARATFSFR